MKVLAAQSCPTLWDPMECSPPGSMGLSRQEYWSGLPFPFPGGFPNPGIKPWGPALQADSLPSEPPGKALFSHGPPLKKWVYMIFCFKREKKKKMGYRLKILFNNLEHRSLITKLSIKPYGILVHWKNSEYVRFGFIKSHTNPSTYIGIIVIW